MRHHPWPGLCTLSPESVGVGFIAAGQGAGDLNTSWPAANDAIFVPFGIRRPIHVARMYTINGTSASGSVDMGIYTEDGGRIVSSGSALQSGTSVAQFFNITGTYLSPGSYFMAISLSNNVGRIRRHNMSVIRQQMLGILKAASAHPLPTSVTFATVTATYVPDIGMELMGIL